MAEHNLNLTLPRSPVAERYARALLELSEESGSTQQVLDDFSRFKKLLDECGDLCLFIKSPTLSSQKQVSTLHALFKKGRISDLVVRFVGMVAQNRRLNILPVMIQCYEYLAVQAEGIVFADVTFAQKPTEKNVSDLIALIHSAIQNKVSLNVSTDPDLIGGLTLQVGSRMIDGSVRSKLNSIRLEMKEIR